MGMLSRSHLRVFLAISSATIVGLSALTPAHAESKMRYVVETLPGDQASAAGLISAGGGSIAHIYSHVLSGFAADLTPSQATALRNSPGVTLVLPDSTMSISSTQSPTPSWGLDRIDQRGPVSGSPGSYSYTNNGAGSTIYVVDTGVYGNNDIASRMLTGDDEIKDGNGTVDCNGHGTHVSSTAAGTLYGVAKGASLVPVRVLGCGGSGSTSGVIAGLDWILSNSNPNPKTKAVVSMSLGGGFYQPLNDAIARLSVAGIPVVVAAGNSSADACNVSPASAPTAITVGATDINDGFAYFSNYGSCVDINAPGVGITGAWIGSPTATNTISGTSMATPHVSGAVAVWVALHPSQNVSEITAGLVAAATTGAISSVPAGTINALLWKDSTDGVPPAPFVPMPGRRGAPIVLNPPAPAPTPTVTTSSASSITATSAAIAGSASQSLTTPIFCFSATNPGSTFDAATCTNVPASGTYAGYTGSLTGLTASTTYYFQLTGQVGGISYYGSVQSFATNAAVQPAPIVISPGFGRRGVIPIRG